MSVLNKLKKNKIIKQAGSIKITVICIFLLFVLTFWGTVAQIDNGLYNSQQRFFTSWFFLALGFFPFPGGQLVLWVLFFNLVCVSISRFVYKRAYLGILIIHFGLLSYFISAFVTLHCVEETNLMLAEGASSNVSSAYHDWELSLWEGTGAKREVSAVDDVFLKSGHAVDFSKQNIAVQVVRYYPNSEAYTNRDDTIETRNDSGIGSIQEVPQSIEPEKNTPGGIFALQQTGSDTVNILLYGGEPEPTKFTLGDKDYYLQLRRHRVPLPFELKLVDFRMEKHPNTDVARSYQSLVEITSQKMSRQVLISMNEPLRFTDYTLYQASYAIDELGREYSTLAVVKNAGRLLPYISSLLTFAGLLIHFLGLAMDKKVRVKNA